MKAREGVMNSEKFGEDLKRLYPVVEADLSDSGSMDCCVEFLMQVIMMMMMVMMMMMMMMMQAGERSLPEAVMTVVPEAWQNDTAMNEDRRNFYRFAACTMEPWDGPALVTFRFVN